MKGKYILIIIMIIFFSFVPTSVNAQVDNQPPQILEVTPGEDETISNNTPMIIVHYRDNYDLDASTVRLVVDNVEVTEWEETTVNDTTTIHRVPEVFEWTDRNHTIEISISDTQGNEIVKRWNVTYDPEMKGSEQKFLSFRMILLIILGVLIGGAAAFFGYYIYLRKTKNFTFEKHFEKNPVKMEYITIYPPIVIVVFMVPISLLLISTIGTSNTYFIEYIIIAGIMIGISPYALYYQYDRIKTKKYEKAFSQFLFEMADAIRSGLNPSKVIVELSKTETGILKDKVKIAADNIKVGRPFDEVMGAFASQIDSSLVKRYANLIAESSKVGGEIGLVLHRAAKDMDEMIKINEERSRHLLSGIAIIYVAFGVLLVIIYQLISIYPQLGDIDLSVLGMTSMDNGQELGGGVNKMGLVTLKKRFFHLMVISSISSGILIGLFKEGDVKEGLVHILAMIAASTIVFGIMIF